MRRHILRVRFIASARQIATHVWRRFLGESIDGIILNLVTRLTNEHVVPKTEPEDAAHVAIAIVSLARSN